MTTTPPPPVLLRDVRLDNGLRSVLVAGFLSDGSLQLEAQDLGGPAFGLSPDGEYEYWRTIAPEHLPTLIELLGGSPGEDILALLARAWTGERSFDLEAQLRQAPFPIDFFSY